MMSIRMLAIGIMIMLCASKVSAIPVDCEAARCAVQAKIDTECPCAKAKNHDRRVACVVRVINRLVHEGSLPKSCRNRIAGCAIRSTCGKRTGSVACHFAGIDRRCRPLRSVTECTDLGGTVGSEPSCCRSCAPVGTPTVPVPTVTPTPFIHARR